MSVVLCPHPTCRQPLTLLDKAKKRPGGAKPPPVLVCPKCDATNLWPK